MKWQSGESGQSGNPNERKPDASKIDKLHAALDKELPEMLTAFRRIEIAPRRKNGSRSNRSERQGKPVQSPALFAKWPSILTELDITRHPR